MSEFRPKRLILLALFFLLGVIITIILTKISNKLYPDDPIVVKEIQDTIHVVHEYKYPDSFSGKDSKIIVSNTKETKSDLKKNLIALKDLKEEREKTDSIIEQLKRQVAEENKEVFKNVYNEIINPKSVFPKWTGSYTYSGETSNFEFYCPQKQTSEYIDLKIKFNSSVLVRDIAALYLTIDTHELYEGKLVTVRKFDQMYSVKDGINLIKIKNYFNDKDMHLSVGYFLKSDSNSTGPMWKKMTCHY